MPLRQDEVLEALKQCYDPAIPVNIVDLGLIYNIRFLSAPGCRQDIVVDMTLTAKDSPAELVVREQIRARLERLPGVRHARVNFVWAPPWSPERLSPEAKRRLGVE
jgi:metal-sulfur cluster biosynthetic enzyme